MISLIVFAILSGDGENTSEAVWVYVLLIAGFVLQCVSVIFYDKLSANSVALSGIRFVQTACYVISFGVFIVARINWLFRLMSKMSAAPLTALFPITIALFAVTIIVHVVSTYLPYKK